VKVPTGERAKTTIDRCKEQLLMVKGTGETLVKFMVPDAGHPKGSWYVESDCPLEVVKVKLDASGLRHRAVLRFRSGDEAEEVRE